MTSLYLEELEDVGDGDITLGTDLEVKTCNRSQLRTIIRLSRKSLMMVFNRNRSQVSTSKSGRSAMSPSPRSSRRTVSYIFKTVFSSSILGNVMTESDSLNLIFFAND